MTDRDLRQHDADIDRITNELQAKRAQIYEDLMDAKKRVEKLEQQLARVDTHLHVVPNRGRD